VAVDAGGNQYEPLVSVVDDVTVTTTQPGRLLVSRTVKMLYAECDGDAAWKYYVTVDGAPVRGTLVTDQPSGVPVRSVTLTGVTDQVVPAGPHRVAYGIVCGSNGALTNFSPSNQATLVVLAG
jgi:hypothetical protein